MITFRGCHSSHKAGGEMKQSARAKRLDEYLTDTYSYEDAMEGMRIYVEDNLVFPFQAKLKGKKIRRSNRNWN